MKLLDPRSVLIGLIGLMTVHLVPVAAQMAPGASPMPGLDSALRKLFNKDQAFSSTAVMEMEGQGQKVTMEVKLSLLDGDTRTEIDMEKIQGGGIPPQAMAQVKAMGMDKIVTLSLKDGTDTVMIYPGMKSYVEMPLLDAKGQPVVDNDCEIKKTSLGTEEVDGRKLEKFKAEVTCKSFDPQEFTLWTTDTPKDFPLKFQTTQGGVTLMMTFKEPEFSKPDAKLFTVPEGYQKYSSMQELMMANMQKLMQQQQAPAAK